MHIVRYADRHNEIHIGLMEGGSVRRFPGVRRIADLLRLSTAELRAMEPAAEPAGAVRLLPPVDGHTEIWAAGVTYERSKQARMEESSEQSVYDRVYLAERPELFFKAQPWRVVTDGEAIGVRADSPLNVPEPELAVFANSAGEIVGYGVCNDVSSRSIEGENPLYLPQAKVYAGSCALAPGIRPAWEVDPAGLEISLEVFRADESCFEGKVHTSALHRGCEVLVEHLFRGQPFPHGAVLATGTGIVPEMDFNLRRGDVVRIGISEVGSLTNQVTDVRTELDWLAGTLDAPHARQSVV